MPLSTLAKALKKPIHIALAISMPNPPFFTYITLTQSSKIFTITLNKPPENRLNKQICQEIIHAFQYIQATLGKNSSGAVITRSSSDKFFCTGLDLNEGGLDPAANSEGFYPLLATILEFPFPTIALITGHCFGGAVPLALAHDYRIMNSDRGYLCMPPVNLGLSFPGIGSLPRLKLTPRVARTMLLEAHRWTGKQAMEDGIVDAIAPPDKMYEASVALAQTWAGKAKMGVYGVLRNELLGEAQGKLRTISSSKTTAKI